MYKMQKIKTKNGLRVRPSYEQLMDAIVEGDIIRPKQPISVFDANWLMSTPQMTQLRKDAFLDLWNLEIQIQKQQLLDMKAKEVARETGKDLREARGELKPGTDEAVYYDISDGAKTDRAMDDAYFEMEIEDAERKRKEEETTAAAVKKVKHFLKETAPNTLAHQLATASSSHQTPLDVEEPKQKKIGRPKIDKQLKEEIKRIISKVNPVEVIELEEMEEKLSVKKDSKKRIKKKH